MKKEESLPRCKYLGRHIGNRVVSPIRPGDEIKKISIFKCHHFAVEDTLLEHCETCPWYEPRKEIIPIEFKEDESKIKEIEGLNNKEHKRTPQNVLINRWGDPVPIGNIYNNAHAFLILSGPSLLENDLSRLHSRGILTMGVNNSPTVVPCSMMIYVDSADKFHHSIYSDPGCMKFVPKPRLKKPVRIKQKDGTFVTGKKVREYPNVIAYNRNAYFNPSTFLWEDSINWGNSKNSSKANGLPRDLNVMFAALRMLFYLGVRTVYLVGCDWNMTDKSPYAFGQAKHSGGVRSNNNKYRTVQEMLSMLSPHFENANYKIYNTNPRSGLELYPYISFDEAIDRASLPQQLDASGWYDKYD